MKKSNDVLIRDVSCYDDERGNSLNIISNAFHKQADEEIPVTK